jgi:hypothetical protein
MLEEKLQLLSILSAHIIDSEDLRSKDFKNSRKAEYAEMFNMVANDCMNLLYPSDEMELETTGNPYKDLRIACESNDVSFEEVKRHGDTYINLLYRPQEKIDVGVHALLIKLWEKATKETINDK